MKKKKSKYKFSISGNNDCIMIYNGVKNETWSVDVLQRMAASTGFLEPVREMAREALEYYDLYKEEDPEIVSDTIVTIAGVKVYLELFGKNFLARIGDLVLRRKSISELETEIREKGV
jgi:hypothetical protein